MKYIVWIILFFTVVLMAACQSGGNRSALNLDFEQVEEGLPMGWESYGRRGYSVCLDSVIVQNGKYSISIVHNGGDFEFKTWSYLIPDVYDGKQITLSGYIKTENVTDGFAGLWMSIDPEVGEEDMHQQGVTGTTDWTKYEITLDMDPSRAMQTSVGGILVGKGKMWLDNLSITIDGKDISTLTPLKMGKIEEGMLYPAAKDGAFNHGSGIHIPAPDDPLVDNLELLGRVWGFLKYHHPAITQGNYNWDYELFRILPDYLRVKNKEERDALLLEWIKKYGKVPPCEIYRETATDAIIKPDFSWVENGDMSDELKKKIKEIYQNRYQGQQYYVRLMSWGFLQFWHENPYANMSFPDTGFRLLSLYRYWNIIHYFFPYKHLCDKDWNAVLKEYIPRFISATDTFEYEKEVLCIIADINDTHANIWSVSSVGQWKDGRFAPSFRVKFIEKKLVVTHFYSPEFKKEIGLEIGDVITHIDGESIEDIVDRMRPYYPMSNNSVGLRDIAENILRSDKDFIDIQYLSSGKKKHKTIDLYAENKLKLYEKNKKMTNMTPCYKFLDDNIGYVTFASIRNEDIPRIKKEFMNAKGIIFDIRNYPTASVTFPFGSYLVSEYTPFAKYSSGNINNPGEIVMGEVIGKVPNWGDTYQGKAIVLVNEESQSNSEYTAMALRAGKNTIVVGSQTAGADGNVIEVMFPGGLRSMFSGIGIYYPDGTETQRIGIVPDVWVEPTIEGVKNGRDEVLEKAIEIILLGGGKL